MPVTRFTQAGEAARTKSPHGWPTNDDQEKLVTLSYDPSTRKVTITAVSGATFDVWVLGTKITVNSPYVSEAHTATVGGWFFYRTESAWVWSQTPWDMREVATTCYVYWSTVANSGVAYTETHAWDRDPEWHWVEHFARGTALISGGVLDNYTLNTDTDAAIQFSITQCVIADEDIHSTLTAKADGAGFTIWRRSGVSGQWTWSTNETLPFLFGTYPQKNYDAGGGTGWAMADIGNGNFVTAYVFAVPSIDSAQRFVIVPGQTEYATVAAARAEGVSQLAFGDLPWTEACPIAQLVFAAKSAYTNTSNSALASVVRLIGSRTAILAAASSASGVELIGGVKITSGAGSPEGVVTAVVGSLYLRTDGGASTTVYVKESGSSTTGWVAK